MSNTIVITKMPNGNVLIKNENREYLSSTRYLPRKDITNSLVEIYDVDGDLMDTFRVDDVEKVVRDGNDIFVTNIDDFFTELITFFFFLKRKTFVILFSNCDYILGTNKDFIILNSDVSEYLSGDSYGINYINKRTLVGSKQILFASSDNSLSHHYTSGNNLQISHYDGTVEYVATTIAAFTDIVSEYFISFIFDANTPLNSKILVNGIDEPLSANTLTSNIDAAVNDYYIGSNGNSLYFEGKYGQMSINSDVETLIQHIEWFKNLISPADIFSNIVKLLNFDDDPLYDRVNSEFGAIDLVNPTISNKMFDITNVNMGLLIADNAVMNAIITSYFSVSMLVKVTNESGLKGLFSKWDTTANSSFSVYYNAGHIYIEQKENGVSKVCLGLNKMVFDEWIHIVAVWEGTNSEIYINGVAESTFNNMTNMVPDATNAPYVAGKPISGLSGANYNLSFIEMISKPLIALEVVELYNNGNPISADNSTFSSDFKAQINPKVLEWNGVIFNGNDLVSGQDINSKVAADETSLAYGGLNVAISRNLAEFDKECNGVISKGEEIDLIFTNGQSNDYGAEALTSLPSEYNGTRNDLKRWNGISYINVDLLTSISNPLLVAGTYAYQPSLINKLVNYTGRSVYLHSYSVSATRLGEDTGSDWNTNSIGEYFDLSATERGLSDIELANNNINIVAEVWNQNENDCAVLAYANAYETNLTNYINKRRLSYPNMKFVIVLVHSALPIGSFPYKATVKSAQLAVAAILPNVVTINQDSFGSAVDNVHRSAQGYEDLGEAIFNEIK